MTAMSTSSLQARFAALAGLASLAMAAASGAHATTYNPPIRMSGGVEYMSGGIGADEAALMRSVEPRWPASFEFTVADGSHGDFAAGLQVTVRSEAGQTILDHVESGGPVMVVRLEPGRYMVQASLAGKVIERNILVNAGSSTHIVFEWPAGTNTAHTASAR